MATLLKKLLYILDSKGRRRIILIMLMTALGAVLELAAVGLIYPFIALITSPAKVSANKFLDTVYRTLGFSSISHFILFMGFLVLGGYVLKNAYLLLMYDIQFKFAFGSQAKLSRALLQAYLGRPYAFHLQRNPAIMLRNLTTEIQNLFNNIYVPVLYLFTDIVLVAAMLVLLLWIDPVVVLGVVALLGGVMGLYDWLSRYKVKALGRRYLDSSAQMMKWASQGLSGVKEIKILGREELFLGSYARNVQQYSQAARVYHTVFQLPRLLLEMVVILGILLVLLFLNLQGKRMEAALPTLAVFAMVGVRLIPTLSRINFSLTSIGFFSPSLEAIYEDVREYRKEQETSHVNRSGPGGREEEVAFKESITLTEVSYTYAGAPHPALTDVSLTIPKGAMVGIVGASGSGKTTLVDTIMGLLPPQDGKVMVDGHDIYQNPAQWQRKIGYIPQVIYLIDDTIRRNIAFGIDDTAIDEDKVLQALRAAQLESFVNSLPKGLDTVVGDRGVRLSGGQRQRIVIARALYDDPEVLVMDEATSSLDGETEAEITKAIGLLSGEKTIIVISHRMSTVQNCDRFFCLENGMLVNVNNSEGTNLSCPRSGQLG